MSRQRIGFFGVLIVVSMLLVSTGAGAQEISVGPDNPAEIVQKGGYDVIVLAEEMGAGIRDRIGSMLTQEFGDKALHWTVKEADGLQYVYAYPYIDNGSNKVFRERIGMEISEFPSTAAQLDGYKGIEVYVCNELYWHGFYLGSVFRICGNQGGSHGYSSLATYGFDNVASSYYETNISCAVDIYNGYNFTSYIGTVVWDWALFNSTYNDKASSVWGYY